LLELLRESVLLVGHDRIVDPQLPGQEEEHNHAKGDQEFADYPNDAGEQLLIIALTNGLHPASLPGALPGQRCERFR
jgi:hypothetical protein